MTPTSGNGVGLAVDPRVRVVAGPQPSATSPMPAVPGATTFHRPLGDRVGDVVHGHLLALGALGVAGGAVAAWRLSGNIVLRGAAGLGIALALPVAAALAGAALSGRGGPDRHTVTTGSDVATAPAGRAGAGGATTTAASGPEHLRVMTFNIREGIGPTGNTGGSDAAIDAIAATIRRDHPDVVVLQEVTDGSLQSQRRDVPAELAQRLHPSGFVVGSSMTQLVGNRKGEAVLTFGDARIESARTLHHPVAGGDGLVRQVAALVGSALGDRSPTGDLFSDYNARSTVDVVVRTAGGRDVRVLTPHLGGGGLPSEGAGGEAAALERQVVPLAATVRAGTDLGLPTIVAGDFNRDASSALGAREVQVLGAAGVRDAFAAAGVPAGSAARTSYPAANPRAAIDHVYVSKELAVRSIAVDSAGAPSSDHRPVVADLQLG